MQAIYDVKGFKEHYHILFYPSKDDLMDIIDYDLRQDPNRRAAFWNKMQKEMACI